MGEPPDKGGGTKVWGTKPPPNHPGQSTSGVDILFTFPIVFHTLIFSHNILPQFLKSKKRHYPPDIFHFFQKGTTRQSFFKFFNKNGTTRQPFFTFSLKKELPASNFSLFLKRGTTQQPFFTFFKLRLEASVGWSVCLSVCGKKCLSVEKKSR